LIRNDSGRSHGGKRDVLPSEDIRRLRLEHELRSGIFLPLERCCPD
jgi:hypothetical protein